MTAPGPWVLVFWLGLLVPAAQAQQTYDRLAPFTAVRFSATDAGTQVEVHVDDAWSELVSLNDLPAKDIVAFARKRYRGRWAKRIGEDLVQVLSEMGHPPGRRVKLVLKTRAGKEKTLRRVRMTESNRDAVRNANNRHGYADAGAGLKKGSEGVERVRRQHSGKVDPRYEFLTRRYWEGAGITPMPAAQAQEDLDQLDWHLTHEYSYLRFRQVDHRAALDSIRASLGEGIAPQDFHIQLRKLVSLFGDGHSRVRGVHGKLVRGCAPCMFSCVGERVIARRANGALLDNDHPYARSIDGVPLARWLEAAGEMVPPGSPRLFRSQCVDYLPFLSHLRSHLGVDPQQPRVDMMLESADGSSARRLRLQLGRGPLLAAFPPERIQPRILEGGIGYLRIPSMRTRDRDLEQLRSAMASFQKTKGLILDVRGNGGGSRQALRNLFPYLMRQADTPRVVNLARYRLPPGIKAGNREGYLQDRYLHPETASVWSKAERDAIQKLAASFEPAWQPKDEEFSAWHYMVISASRDPGIGHYDRPVVLLIDSGCFSATDIFVGAFWGWRNVTLVGTTTGGGSGRTQQVRLANSGLRVRLSTMASFRPNGKPYDGLGIDPDVVAEPTLADVLGKGDSVLDLAIKRLRRE